MKKKTVHKIASIVLSLVAILAIVCAVTVTGSGFLDLSNVVRVICIGVAVVCGILAVLAWTSSKPKC